MAARHTTPDSAHETGRNRPGYKAHQVGKSESPNQEIAHAGGDCSDYEYARGGDEQRVTFGLHGGGNLGHHDHHRGTQSGDCPAIPAREGDDKTGGKVSKQHQTDALGGIRGQQSGEYEAPERDLSDK